MTARKLTKSEKRARLRRKEAAARKDKREPLTMGDIWAMHVIEAREALIRQGWTKEDAMEYVIATFHAPSLPDWLPVNPEFLPLEDDDDEDE